MPRPGSFQLARILGIRIGVHASWFVVLFFFIFVLSGSFRDTLNGSDSVAYAVAVASALLFFASLILHELGHAVVARRVGIGISGIDLWFFGGVAKMTRDPETPGEEFKVAVAGPVVTLAVIALCAGLGIAFAGAHDFLAASPFGTGRTVSPGLLLVSWLATINAGLFVFNVVPAFPLDGGRLARAAAWRLTGDRIRATRIASVLGQAFSWFLIASGLLLVLAEGALTSGLWFIALGWIVGQAARAEVTRTVFSERIDGVTVADIMDPEPVAVPQALPVERAQEEFFLRYRWPFFPVVDGIGRFVGVVRQDRVEEAERAGGSSQPVGELMDDGSADCRIGEDARLDTLLASEPLRRLGALMAVDPDGILRGVVTLDQVRRALQAAALTGRPGA